MQDSQIDREHKDETQPLLGSADSLLGVCEAIGKDVGFNPFYLRIALLSLLVVQPLWMIGAYAALGIVVLVARLLFPDVPAEVATTAEVQREPAVANQQGAKEGLQIAA